MGVELLPAIRPRSRVLGARAGPGRVATGPAPEGRDWGGGVDLCRSEVAAEPHYWRGSAAPEAQETE